MLDLVQSLGLAPWLDEAVALISYGTRQKVGALIALLGDPGSALRFKRHLRARVDAGRCGVLLATHALDIAEHWADGIALLHEGTIALHWGRDRLNALRTTGTAFETALTAQLDALRGNAMTP